MVDNRTRTCLLVLFLISISFLLPSPSTAQNCPQNFTPTYTKGEIDARLNAIIAEIKSLRGTDTYSKNELDAKLDAIRAELKPLQAASPPSKAEVDAKLDGLEKSFKAQIDALVGKVAAIPFWLPVVVSALSFLIAAATFGRGLWTRAEDQQQRVADINRVEDRQRKDSAVSLMDQWTEREDLAANVTWILANPSSLNEKNYGPECRLRLLKLGNWFNTLATRWRRNEADDEALLAGDMAGLAKTFWGQFQHAKGVLAADPSDTADLAGLESQWPDLAWLVANK